MAVEYTTSIYGVEASLKMALRGSNLVGGGGGGINGLDLMVFRKGEGGEVNYQEKVGKRQRQEGTLVWEWLKVSSESFVPS